MGLSREIAKAAGWHRVEPRHCTLRNGAWIEPGEWLGRMSDGKPILDSLHGTTMHREPPNFTGSLDAAVTLEPKDAKEIVVRVYPSGVYVLITLASGKVVYWEGFNNPKLTEAMARCAAALRARAAMVKP